MDYRTEKLGININLGVQYQKLIYCYDRCACRQKCVDFIPIRFFSPPKKEKHNWI